MSDEVHLRPAIQMGLRYDVWVSPERLRLKQGMRKREVALADVTHFGVRRLPDDSARLTELRLVTADGKAMVLPYNPNDDDARALLAKLAELRPDADVSGLMWTDAAPLLRVRAFGLRDTLMHPWVAGGLGCLLLAPAALGLINTIAPDHGNPMMGSAAVVIMVGGAITTGVGVMKVGAAREEEAARQRRAAAHPGDASG